MQLLLLALGLSADGLRFLSHFFASAAAIRADAFLRKQLAMFVERGVKPRRASDREKIALVLLARLFDWRDALLVVTPRTFLGWKQAIDRAWWRWISRPKGRPPLPLPMREVIRKIARENPQWSCGQIARVVAVQLGLRVDEKTVRRHLPLSDPRRRRRRHDNQTWSTFVRNHAKEIAACDFVSVMTLRFRVLYIFVVMEIGSRRILHVGVTEHPTAEWTSQQLREAIPSDSPIRHLIHDGSGQFNSEFRRAAQGLGIVPLRTPPYAPKANAFCERLIGTMRRQCLDWIIPLGERHLRGVVREWAAHYNRARPHMSLGPGVPEPGELYPATILPDRHVVPADADLVSDSILGGLHHEYRLTKRAA